MRLKLSTKSEELQRIINDYMADSAEETIDMRKVADWAIANDRWRPQQNYDPARICAKELSRAARQEVYEDPQGREVRKKHCYPIVDESGQYRWIWVDIATANPEQMHKSLATRRRSALGDVVQLATDLASYNENNRFGAQLEMSFNFDEDLAELAHPEDYPEED